MIYIASKETLALSSPVFVVPAKDVCIRIKPACGQFQIASITFNPHHILQKRDVFGRPIISEFLNRDSVFASVYRAVFGSVLLLQL